MPTPVRASKLARLFDRLEKYYGKQQPHYPRDPYEMIVYNNCAYPSVDQSCRMAFDALRRSTGVGVDDILDAREADLTEPLRLGGAFAEARAGRLKEIASMVRQDFGGDLRLVLKKPLPDVRKALKRFPTIGEPGADKILLFTGTAPVAAVPSNCVHVPVRLGIGEERKNYAATYRSAQEALQAALPQECGALQRAYLLLKRHGWELCKRSRPLCASCPVKPDCLYLRKAQGGTSHPPAG